MSHVNGHLNIAGGDINQRITTSSSATEIKQLFDGLYTVIESNKRLSRTKKEDFKAEVKEIQSTVTQAVQKNEKLEEGFLSRRFRNIARMAHRSTSLSLHWECGLKCLCRHVRE